jgi:hypothetical protein
MSTKTTTGERLAHSAWQRALLWSTLAGLGAVATLTTVVLLRYPGGERARAATLAFAVLALGSAAGLAAGALWLAEISFNNVLPPDLSVPRRDLVDNLFWLATVLLTLAAAIAAGWSGGRLSAGTLAGAWAGLLSGLIACLYGLALVVFRLDLILRDPLAQAEFAVRGPRQRHTGHGDLLRPRHHRWRARPSGAAGRGGRAAARVDRRRHRRARRARPAPPRVSAQSAPETAGAAARSPRSSKLRV